MKKNASIRCISNFYFIYLFVAALMFFASCSSDQPKEGEKNSSNADLFTDDGKGIGPVKDVKLGAIDSKMAEEGKALFDTKCIACHQFTADKVVGPGLLGVTKRRKPEWIENMILNPMEMTAKDPTAVNLLTTYLSQMTNQNLSEPEARKILEYFRRGDGVMK